MNSNQTSSHKPSILIVDDNPRNLQILGQVLKEQHYDIEFAISGKAALDWIATHEFDLILLDINMPEMSGFEVCCTIRSNIEWNKIPIIFLSADSERESILKGFELGAQDYITKPFDSRELVSRVKTHLKLRLTIDELENLNRSLEKNTLEIEEINIKLNTKNEELSNSKKSIELIHNNVLDSINYALGIQKAMLPLADFVKQLFPENFILFKPKDIISGDFYFAKQIKQYSIIAAVDCTGHGVPGAILSTLSITLLNEIVYSPKVTSPATVLDKLRVNLKSILQQTGYQGNQKDGLDIALCYIDIENNQMEYSGAFNPLWLYRKSLHEKGPVSHGTQYELIEFPADKQPVGISDNEKPFTNHRIQLQNGDIFYIFSDGFYSQFGGPNDKKINKQLFRELLKENLHTPMQDQKHVLNDFFEKWKGDSDQTDDVLVIGVKIQT